MATPQGDSAGGSSNPAGSSAGSSRPISGIPRRNSQDSDGAAAQTPTGRPSAGEASPAEGKARFAAAAKSAAGAAQGPSTKPSSKNKKSGVDKVKGIAKNAAGAVSGFAGAQGSGGGSGLASKAKSLVGGAGKKNAGKKTAGEAAKKTSDLKKAGKDASKNVKKGTGSDGGDPNKAGLAKRAGKAVTTLGKQRCVICGYQNGLNKEGVCKRCVKMKRTDKNDVGAAEKAKNAAIDVTAKAGAKALGTAVGAATFGAVPPEVVSKLTEGFIGKGLAVGAKFAKYQLIIIGGFATIMIMLVFFLIFSVAGLGGGNTNIQADAEVGAMAENAAEVPPAQLDTYVAAASRYELPWSILAGVGEATTQQGTVSPYDEETRTSTYPFVSPAIVGETGRGPMLLTGQGLGDGTVKGSAPGGGEVLNPKSADLKFEKRAGRVNPGGELLPGTAAAQDFIEQAFPNSPVTSDWRPPDPPYNYHNRGEALDVGCKGECTKSDIERLHVIAAWFAQNPDVFGLSYIIWEQRENSGNGWTVMPDRGDANQNHYNHIHLNFGNPGVTSLGKLGGSWPGSALSDVSANTANSPFSGIEADEDNSGESTVSPDDGVQQETPGTVVEDESRQDFVREVDALAQLVAESRDTVYAENEEFYRSEQLDIVKLSQNPFKDEVHIEFWQKVLERLPIDFENTVAAKSGGGGSSGSGNNVILGDDREAVISQLIWAKRWIESSNTYDLVNTYGYAGAYQYGRSTWNNYGGYPTADKAPKEVQDRKMSEDYAARLDLYNNDVKKAVQHHLCPAYVGQDEIICELAGGLSSKQVNPDMGTYWACAAVLLNALPGNENKYSYKFTSAPGGVENYERNCRGRIPNALTDIDIPTDVRQGGTSGGTTPVAGASEGEVAGANLQRNGPTTTAPENETPKEESEKVDFETVPVSGTPKETVFALASIEKAGQYSGLELNLVDNEESSGGGNDRPEGGVIDGDPSEKGFIWPTSGAVTSGFGMRWGKPHQGIDIAPQRGTPVVASKAGEVVFVYDGCGEGSAKSYCGAPPFGGYGNVVTVKHDDGLYTMYAHLEPNTIGVQLGDPVLRGQVLGAVGSSGNSTGPHLHFEIRQTYTGGQVDPLPFMPQR
jgi:murein DD-endopeptidase MepM/ murein hydrolase activator NlpD